MEDYFNVLKTIQKGEDKKVLCFIKQFYPLIKKYAVLLNYEDAYFDLELYFIKIIYTLNLEVMKNTSDSSILKYINTSVYHEYIRLSKRYNKTKAHEYTVSNETISSDIVIPIEDDFSNLFFNDIKKHLSDREYKVIYMFFYESFSINEIAEELDETTYNIYKIKAKALDKLRKTFQT